MTESNLAKPKGRSRKWIAGISVGVVVAVGLSGWYQYHRVQDWGHGYLDAIEQQIPRMAQAFTGLGMSRSSEAPGKSIAMGAGDRMGNQIESLAGDLNDAYQSRPYLTDLILSDKKTQCIAKLRFNLYKELVFLHDINANQYSSLDVVDQYFSLHNKTIASFGACLGAFSNGKRYATDDAPLEASTPIAADEGPVEAIAPAASAEPPKTESADPDSEASLKLVSYPEQVDIPLDFSPMFKSDGLDCEKTVDDKIRTVLGKYIGNDVPASKAISDLRQGMEEAGVNAKPFVSQLYAVAYRTGNACIACMAEAHDYAQDRCKAAIKH